ncbi:kinase-like protein [Calocera cornea HHB12733]|uniref:Kinase-like protein n=1 Tax=Calocera cornea HHB12733 TaxID=1353952 RepID=A0A165EI28_9BASI|nr:kinase-like protein [Calocera cornea HHB12733]
MRDVLSLSAARVDPSLCVEGITDVARRDDGGSQAYVGDWNGVLVVATPVKNVTIVSLSQGSKCATMLFHWKQLFHPNVLEFIGVSTGGPYGVDLVSPWMEHGDISTYLRANPGTPRSPLLVNVVQGLSYLHSRQPLIVHGDLRPSNILIQSNGQACLANFGIPGLQAAGKSEDQYQSTATDGRVLWMAPEQINPLFRGHSEVVAPEYACDIYSFGLSIYQIYTGLEPFHEARNVALWTLLAQIVRDGRRPQHPGYKGVQGGLQFAMWRVAEDCWKKEPEERPTSRDLVRRVSEATRGG